MEYKLVLSGGSDMPLDRYEKNFSFIVNGQEIKTNRLIADFLSPIIRRFHYSDSSINTFSINIKKENDETDEMISNCFKEFLALFTFETQTLSKAQCKYYIHFFYALGNINEYLRLQPEYLKDLNSENAISKFKMIRNMLNQTNSKLFPTENGIYDELIKFISSHFSTIPKEEMKSLTNDELEQILSNESLRIHDEDELFKFVSEIYKENRNNFFLFDFVIFSNLNEESLHNFIEEFNYDDMDEVIWKSFCSLIKKSDVNSNDSERYKIPSENSIQNDHENETISEIDKYCTYAVTGTRYSEQKWYYCRTCGLTGNKGMCEICAQKCHKNHDVAFYKNGTGFYCDCPDHGGCCCMPQSDDLQCTFVLTGGKIVEQPMYNCLDCNIQNICQNCAIKHHKNHKVHVNETTFGDVCHYYIESHRNA